VAHITRVLVDLRAFFVMCLRRIWI